MIATRIASTALAIVLLATSSLPVFAQEAVNTGTDSSNTVTTPPPATETGMDRKDRRNRNDGNEHKKNGKDGNDRKDRKENSKDQTPVDLVCMQTAVGTRDDAIIAALEIFHANVKTGLTARRDALKAAWAITDKDARKEAIKKAWAEFKGTWKNERKTLNDSKVASWKTFQESRKTCHAEGEGEEQGNDRDL